MKKKGMNKVSTDNIGNILGAKKGKMYATNVTTVNTIFKKNIPLLNHESFFISFFIRYENYQ
ncbi:hypothetical protein M2326_002524 [Flavobacterium sp. 7A]|nr:hypothetical protein [Flavobacterium sp. 7A]